MFSGLFALFGKTVAISGPLAAFFAVAFAILVGWHARIIEREGDTLRWARVNRDGELRALDRFRELPEDGRRFVRPDHPYADDLDVFGHGSLFQRVSVAHTRFGQNALADFLRAPAQRSTILERQAAVRELAPKIELRQRLEALSIAVVDSPERKDKPPKEPPDPEPLLRWAESAPRLRSRTAVVYAARILPVVTLAGLAFGGSLGWGPWVWAAPLFLQLFLNFQTRNEASEVFTAVSSTEGAFLRYGSMLELLENMDAQAPLLRDLRERVAASGKKPSAAMQEFRRKVGWFDLRHNGLIHPVANLVLLWDIQCVLALENWQARVGGTARAWFSALGELESLSSFANLAHDEPEFAFPDIADGSAVFVAAGLAHPLIGASVRVENDVSLPSPGTALLVTGSNMSGKSTLLRATGLAAVLALAGAPVCAKSLRISPCLLRTSIRVSDSLEGGVSHFYAELAKLKAVIDAARSPTPVLFLLDEILHGTNSRERQIGARWVMSKLIEQGAIGAVSTHDMELCRLSDALMKCVTLVHFRENVENGRMTFDYKLRPGPVTAGNALRLMQLIGLPVPLG